MAKRKKIVILTAEEAAEINRKARGRAVFKSMLENGQLNGRTVQDKRKKAAKKDRQKEDHRIKRGDYQV